MMTEHESALQVTELLWKLENDLDAAFATAGALAMALPRARAEAKLSAVVGQHAFEMLGQAMMAIGQARGHTVQSHRILEKVGKTIGFDADEYGDNRPKPPEVTGTVSPMPLRAAA
ncbi:hypothetical protein QE385_003025 [Sphingomonas sp. SORGH_AS 950]|uniref:hypothetical protein n=1 Tax=unclassified Sphingomonas TaxID=196159 RepID=UPI002782C0CE|nr:MULTISPECIES: hypothetical protein [unclassified Sphingomonas]MDQ1158698.1 hypothetical protein [Sphingomonas sp. SORGH_AS_0950]MDR6113462.1 hypothetical protein [Sphingomonas sp. SORGH_AS_0789]MDR6145428.1 hypothetical protein [Sphingomonas sp. SORGH_AS_0870]MDR6149177.1 hypothetical protein [Sphingomonas sp. SORGH_AS_0742]